MNRSIIYTLCLATTCGLVTVSTSSGEGLYNGLPLWGKQEGGQWHVTQIVNEPRCNAVAAAASGVHKPQINDSDKADHFLDAISCFWAENKCLCDADERADSAPVAEEPANDPVAEEPASDPTTEDAAS